MNDDNRQPAVHGMEAESSWPGRRRWARWLQLLWCVLAVSACAGAREHAGPEQQVIGARLADPVPPLVGDMPWLGTLQALLSSPSSPVPEITEVDFAKLRRFYAERDNLPLWVGRGGLEAAGETLWSRLQSAHSAGQSSIAPLLEAAAARNGEAVGRGAAELELLFSAALMRGAIDPRDPASPAQRPEVLAEAAALRDVAGLVRNVLPIDPALWRLRSAIQTYRDIGTRGGWPRLGAGANLELGVVDARVTILRERLRITGDLTATASRPELFDAALAEGVRRFQLRHGVLVDGIVGEKTLAAINVSLDERLRLMELNLARLVEERREWGQRYIMVNAAAATYRLVDGGRPVFERAAIVGRGNWPTPRLEGVIDRLELNPYWVVPPRIARLEVLPKIGRDPDYLRRNDMHWSGGQIRQNPGPANPLGKVKFLFANPYDVYLHDTNSPQLFLLPDRHLSHGCVRAAGALDLAIYLLRDDPQWTPQNIQEALRGWQNIRIPLVRPIPLHIVYDTAWVDDAGIVDFREDVYGRDRYPGRVAAGVVRASQAGCPIQDQETPKDQLSEPPVRAARQIAGHGRRRDMRIAVPTG